ncbi:MAG: energy transducer TonB [Smithella sp.]|nr:energy transducer TonB [Smithella sp.]
MTFRTTGNRYRGSDGNFHSMIFLSLILHVIVIAVLLVSIPTTSKRLTFGAAYSVQLVGAEAVMTSGASSLMSDVLRTRDSSTDAIILKRKIESIYSTPAKTREASKVDVEKALGAIRKKESGKTKTDDSTAAVSGAAKISESDMTAQTNDYIGTVWMKVKENWGMPPSLLPETNITTIIDVRISRSGALEYVGFEKRSGNPYFDESALKAVKKSSPFPPLPFWVRDNRIEIGIRFHSNELR